MIIELTTKQKIAKEEFRSFVNQNIIPYADQWDREAKTPRSIIEKLAERGYLGSIVPKEYNGIGMDMITFGILNEELGRGCSSIRSLLTVHSMVIQSILRWGTNDQKDKWLPKLASGKTIGAFCLSEPNTGSDISNIETIATSNEKSYILKGQKKWITYGEIADLYLVFAQLEGSPTAFLLERENKNLYIKPQKGIIGTSASMLAELDMKNCLVPQENLICKKGFGIKAVASNCLDLGRLSVAWGCVGIGQACVEASLKYASERKQFGVLLKNHQLIKGSLAEMITEIKAARMLGYQASYLKGKNEPTGIMEVSIFKYFASRMANNVANSALQLHGANGLSDQFPVQRFMRDAKVMEIIEGSTQIQQITIPDYGYQELNQMIKV